MTKTKTKGTKILIYLYLLQSVIETRLMHCISYSFGIVLSHGNVDYAAPETFYKVMLYDNDED